MILKFGTAKIANDIGKTKPAQYFTNIHTFLCIPFQPESSSKSAENKDPQGYFTEDATNLRFTELSCVSMVINLQSPSE